MRLWSVHPKYLDAKGLVALWREGLLAQNVLAGKTKGYRHHPQLHRFLETNDPLAYIGSYLNEVVNEAEIRGYSFDRSKILKTLKSQKPIRVTRGQLQFEFQHLLKKLQTRDANRFEELKTKKRISPHPCLVTVPGVIQSWERLES